MNAPLTDPAAGEEVKDAPVGKPVALRVTV